MKSCKLSDITRVFQFTPLREGRRGNGCQHGADRRISIHAPPRGATAASCPSLWHHEFQFTPLREGRRRNSSAATRPPSFQFTPLREGRLC